MNIILDIEPPTITHQVGTRQRVVVPRGKKPYIHRYKSTELERVEKLYYDMLIMQRPLIPMDGPILCTTVFVWTYRKSEKRSIVNSGELIFKPTKPDLDNINKLLKDVMEKAGYFGNDSQITFGKPLKFWGPYPFIGITLEEAVIDEEVKELVKPFVDEIERKGQCNSFKGKYES